MWQSKNAGRDSRKVVQRSGSSCGTHPEADQRAREETMRKVTWRDVSGEEELLCDDVARCDWQRRHVRHGLANGLLTRGAAVSRLVIFVENPFIPRMLVLTIRGMEIITVLAMHRHNPTSQDTYSSMQNQPSKDIIRFLLETEQDMNLTEQELNQWIEQRDQEAEEEIKSILQKISAETMSAIPLESVEVNEVTPIEDYWSEPEEIIEVSLYEPDISIAQNEADEAEKKIDVILERPEEPQKESKEDQPLVLVKPPTLPCIFVRPYKGVVVKERSQIFYTADTFVLADHNLIDSYVLEVLDELLHPKEGMYDELPKAIDAPFVVDISKGEDIT
ncbi:hypothetical protein Sjap_010892 [Stephania japonica]|uniref:Uncharacterized protein n=1 Tax=Stephania japonica TaxID=461633 RepID=A0AAP0P6X0_9MAGN